MPTYTRKVVLQTFWTCKTCGTKNPGLKGKEDESLRCSNCGNQKSDEPYKMPEDVQTAPEVTDARLLEFANAGENWTCGYCRRQERNLHDRCSACGAPRGTTPTEAPVEMEREIPRRRSNRRRFIGFGIASICIICVVWLLVWLFTPHETNARVVAHSWTRTENLRERKTVSYEDWRGDLPMGSFDVSCEKKKKGEKDCKPYKCDCKTEYVNCNCTGGDPEDCRCKKQRYNCKDNGNGSATCDEEEKCDTCYTERTCEKCPKMVCDTCYEKCPVYDRLVHGQILRVAGYRHEDRRRFESAPRLALARPGCQRIAPARRAIGLVRGHTRQR